MRVKPVRNFRNRVVFSVLALGLVAAAAGVVADTESKEPYVGQPGKDAVWVPTPDELVEKMLDLAEVTPDDFVMDLGSGDGRMIIAAAKRGVRARGVEFDEALVRVSRERAEKEGVADLAEFVQGDMFAADLSEATVLALFLLERNLNDLVPNFMKMKPGSRIVKNTFRATGWEPDVTERLENCTSWCTAHLHIVPAQVEGRWRLGEGELSLEQKFQMVSGTLQEGKETKPVEGRLLGADITLTIDGVEYAGSVADGEMSGTRKDGTEWRAVRQ